MKRILFITLILSVLVVPSAGAVSKAGEVKTGNELYLKGNYAAATEKYENALKKDPESDVINFNLGTGYYKKNEYDQAVEHLQRGLLSDDLKLRQRAFYNLGNAFYQQGLGQEDKNIEGAVNSLKQSLQHLDSAIKLDDKDNDAKYNYEVVKKELERLEKKQQQQQKRQQKQEQQSQGGQGEQKNLANSQSGQENKPASQEPSSSQEQKKEPAQQTPEPSAEQKEPSAAPNSAENKPSTEKKGNPQNAQELNKDEAEMLLKDYQRNEEPQGLLNFTKHKSQEVPVTKDW